MIKKVKTVPSELKSRDKATHLAHNSDRSADAAIENERAYWAQLKVILIFHVKMHLSLSFYDK